MSVDSDVLRTRANFSSVIFSVTLIIYVINLVRHRRSLSTVGSVRQPQGQAVPIPAHKVEMA